MYIYIYMGVDQNPVLSRAPPSVTNLCRGLTNPCRGLVAEGFVAEHPHLLQTFVAKWPPKPVTRPMFLIRCHDYVYTCVSLRVFIGRRAYVITNIILRI